MDNHYVPNLSFGPMICQALKPHARTAEGQAVPIDVHLMVQPVDALAAAFAEAGADLISFHPDATGHVHRSIQAIKASGCKVGLVFNPASSLDVHRLSVGPELRYQLLTPLYVFAHVLPAFAHSKASLDDSLTLAPRTAKHWAYGADFALGAAFELYGMRSGESKQPRLWAIAEGGYGYLGSTKLRLEPEAGQGAPERTAPVDLGSLSLAGPYLRVSAAVSF